ncbi:MAG: phosphate-starvation-inducible PsiE family protein [Halieaceae bacterium]
MKKSGTEEIHDELTGSHHDPLIRKLHVLIQYCVRTLAILMVIVIFFGVLDVIYVGYNAFFSPPYFLLDVGDIFRIFGAFMMVLIAIEIFINIRLYLGSNELPIKLVIATALMAIARKVIVLDITTVTSDYVFSIAAVILALGVAYFLIEKTTVKSATVFPASDDKND